MKFREKKITELYKMHVHLHLFHQSWHNLQGTLQTEVTQGIPKIKQISRVNVINKS